MSLVPWLSAARAVQPLVDPAPDIEAELGPFDGPLELPPRTRAEVVKIFGHPGVGTVDPKWERANLVVARHLPGRWNGAKGKLYVHRLAEPYVREGLRRCQVLGCLEDIETLGCFNFRHQRHDPTRPLSYHAWAIALDVNSATNAGRYVRPTPEPWSPEWMALYPTGLSRNVVRAFESSGWSWGGRWTGGFSDPMHFSLING